MINFAYFFSTEKAPVLYYVCSNENPEQLSKDNFGILEGVSILIHITAR